MLLGVLAKAAGVIGDIIADPIGFLGNLIGGIKAGLTQLRRQHRHPPAGGADGLAVRRARRRRHRAARRRFDIKGIFDLVLQVLGLTYANIRARVVKHRRRAGRRQARADRRHLQGPRHRGHRRPVAVDQGQASATSKRSVIGGIKDFIIEKVIKAGITWLIAFLNPAAAFIKACKAIYDIIMFLIERGSEIMEFVNSILDSIGAIAKGNIGRSSPRRSRTASPRRCRWRSPSSPACSASAASRRRSSRSSRRSRRRSTRPSTSSSRARSRARRSSSAAREVGQGQVREGQGVGQGQGQKGKDFQRRRRLRRGQAAAPGCRVARRVGVTQALQRQARRRAHLPRC